MTRDEPLETTACPLCGGTRLTGRRYDFPPYAVVRCAGCSLGYLSPRPTEESAAARYRADDYFAGEEGGYADYAGQERALRATFRRLLAGIARRGHGGGELLEIGCGFGFLLDEARGGYGRRCGTELSPAAAGRAAARADAVWTGDLRAVPVEARFDCIVATQVIEHVHRPRDFVAAVRERLRPGGAAVLTTPNLASPLRLLLGRRWPSFKIPEHVTFFDRRTLARLMREAGLVQVAPLSHPHAFPLGLLARHLGLPLPAGLAAAVLWVPTTVVAVLGVRPR